MIPPIPKKKNKGKFENDFIKKRMYFLERFLNACMNNEDIKACKYFQGFLQMDESKFKNLKKDGDKANKVNKIDELQFTKGSTKIEISPDLKKFAANAGDLFNQTDPIYKKIRKLSK
mmetsp:Transcript_11931/g.10299  ORF Transcript_11931/g.10299 Transcript_11931/m.10299 type:complete len:117 (-) Transcript_11931:866-1216(-)|eukprot:CAMPEP_0114588098 /NCGR_PEP_ID=MMETSP0125-20121206/10891_1 /TAXON_ID=485358 ORGANISM="Aristerostoma sp., Strain ATCC 50986" /NCGR_SAMPLE_ID=MMETSP0125 /ASSEMBLY_ACC=CAM_ASM_000245 /LENGTH=116 /DNA_ID=CAMNT_0001784335 /DNA_START=701 /DNA_END=1051 /DNA_ORIENTATION=-